MTPGSFDLATAREIVGDEQARRIEAKARADAEAGDYRPPADAGVSYWSQVRAQMDEIVYHNQYAKRRARIERKGAKP